MTEVPFLTLAPAEPDLWDELIAAAQRVLRSGHYIRGTEVERFEHDFARHCGVAGAVGVGNGLEALQLTLTALGVGPGDEVLVSAHTSIATWLGITHAGAWPVPIDADPRTMLIDPAKVEQAIGPRTAALVPVHLYGMPADMGALEAIARKHHVALLEDASQAHGARLGGRPIGSFGNAAAFSLYPTKNLGAIGDAGIVVSDDTALLDRIRMLANYGERRRHQSELCGYNSRLDELQAAFLRVKLPRLDGWNERRRARVEQYVRELDGSDGVELPLPTKDALPVWHQFVVRLEARDTVREELARLGVESLVHYPIPPHRSVAYAPDYPYPVPIAEKLAQSVLSLPISPQLSEDACARVCKALTRSVAVASAGR